MIQEKESSISKPPFYERMHPFELMFYLAVGSSFILFLVLITAFFLLNRQSISFGPIPHYFILGTITLLISSKPTMRLSSLFQLERNAEIRNSILVSIIGGFGFILFQFLGWVEIQSLFVKSNGQSIFMLLVLLHVLHVFVTLLFSIWLFDQYLRMSVDPIHDLVQRANPFEKDRIRLFTYAWLYLDGTWIAILSVFIFLSK